MVSLGIAAATALVRTYHVVWQVEIDMEWSTWLDYPADQIRRVEAAWQAMATEVQVCETDWSDGWLLDLARLVQVSDSGTRRRIRRLLVTHS